MKSPKDKPTAAEFGQMTAYLAKRKVKLADVKKKIGSTVNNRSRADIVQNLNAWLKTGKV